MYIVIFRPIFFLDFFGFMFDFIHWDSVDFKFIFYKVSSRLDFYKSDRQIQLLKALSL